MAIPGLISLGNNFFFLVSLWKGFLGNTNAHCYLDNMNIEFFATEMKIYLQGDIQ